MRYLNYFSIKILAKCCYGHGDKKNNTTCRKVFHSDPNLLWRIALLKQTNKQKPKQIGWYVGETVSYWAWSFWIQGKICSDCTGSQVALKQAKRQAVLWVSYNLITSQEQWEQGNNEPKLGCTVSRTDIILALLVSILLIGTVTGERFKRVLKIARLGCGSVCISAVVVMLV